MDQVQGSSARGLWLSLNENRSSAGQGPGFNISEGEVNLITIAADLEMDNKDLICRSITLA
jgi:hypothetical protein